IQHRSVTAKVTNHGLRASHSRPRGPSDGGRMRNQVCVLARGVVQNILTNSNRLRLLAALLVLLAVPATMRAQYTDDRRHTGQPSFGSFHGSDFETVLLQNGNLHVDIPVLSLPMRQGKAFTWKYIYDAPAWQGEWIPNPLPSDPNNGQYRIVPLSTVQF